MEKDPVCGMEVDPRTTKETSEFDDTTYYFCSRSCKNKFDLEPEKYVVEESGAD